MTGLQYISIFIPLVLWTFVISIPLCLQDFFTIYQEDVDIKYIDPTYMIRSGQTSAADAAYCKVLGQASVHTAFSGYTGVTLGMVNNHYVLLPADKISTGTRTINPDGRHWNRSVV